MKKHKQQIPTTNNTPVWFDVPCGYNDVNSVAIPLTVDQEAFFLCWCDGTVLFRKVTRNQIEWTYFLYRRFESAEELRTFLTTDFAACYAASEYGRCLFYDCPEAQHCQVMLCLRQDGTGYFQEYQDCVEFTYHEEWVRLAVQGDILRLPATVLEPLCQEVFVHQVWPAMKDPYLAVGEILTGQELEFICGSEEELKQLTRWIFHTAPSLFHSNALCCVYEAALDGNSGGPRYYGYMALMRETYPNLRSLCELAFEYNTFTGSTWEYVDINGNRHSGYKEYPLMLGVDIEAPSPRDQKEALENLSVWLEGKVPPDERLKLLLHSLQSQ